MPVELGTTDVDKIYLGTTEVEKVYLGTVEVYTSAPTPPNPPTNLRYDSDRYRWDAPVGGPTIAGYRYSIAASPGTPSTFWRRQSLAFPLLVTSAAQVAVVSYYVADGVEIYSTAATFSR